MKLQKSKPPSLTDSETQGVNKPLVGAVVLTSAAFAIVWLSVGGVGRIMVAIAASSLHGPVSLTIGRLLGRGELRRNEFLISLVATVATAGVLNYLALVMSGRLSGWLGFDALSLFLATVLTALAFLAWFFAKKTLFR